MLHFARSLKNTTCIPDSSLGIHFSLLILIETGGTAAFLQASRQWRNTALLPAGTFPWAGSGEMEAGQGNGWREEVKTSTPPSFPKRNTAVCRLFGEWEEPPSGGGGKPGSPRTPRLSGWATAWQLWHDTSLPSILCIPMHCDW